MPTQSFNIDTRINALNAVLTNKNHRTLVEKALTAAKGDWSLAFKALEDEHPEIPLSRLDFAHSLADLSNDNIHLVKTLDADPKVNTLRDVALNFNVEGLTKLVNPGAAAGTPAHDKALASAVGFRQKLFTSEPTAVLQRMVIDAEIPIADRNVATGVTQFLNNQPAFNIRTTSVYNAIKATDAFKNIADEQRADVVEHVKTMQRVQALTLVPEAVPVLMNANLTSAFHVGEMPESTFMRSYGEALGEDVAKQVYTNAINNRIRNEHALMTMWEAIRGTGLAIMDGNLPGMVRTQEMAKGPMDVNPDMPPHMAMMHEAPEAEMELKPPMQNRMAKMQKVADNNKVPLNLEALFGSMDYCECDECLSVYSPAAYFVELLQYLRNNNLGPDPATGDPDPAKNKNIHPGLVGTPLEMLFRRRPDLGCLDLTCENTFTVLPYIDLVNEVMESFVVHIGLYSASNTKPKQATIDAFDVEGETSSELLAQPQHTNYEAYCILKSAVYPFTLPYHQPIDATRIFLNYLGTSRYELLDTYRTAHEICPNDALTPAELENIQKLHKVVQDRAVDAEFLGMTQEEYIILTKEAFWKKDYFDITLKTAHTVQEYREKIGVKPVHEYYGYDNEPNMLSLDENAKVGLTFVKKQFLPRTGIQYTDLVDLLKTRFINPNFPQGKALTILENIRFSYRFLQTLVVPGNDPTARFAKLIEFLEKPQTLLPNLEPLLHPEAEVCHKLHQNCSEISSDDLKNWVYCYFDRIGQLIVLESGERSQLVVGPLIFERDSTPSGPVIPIEGGIFKEDDTQIGTFRKDGTIVDDTTGATIGHVTFDLQVLGVGGKPFIDQFGGETLSIRVTGILFPVTISEQGLEIIRARILWLPPGPDTCNLDKVRLTHLDGSPITVDEYDGIHRFIRLWRKLGWTIDETDKALAGMMSISANNGAGKGVNGNGDGTGTEGEKCDFVTFDNFVDTCDAANDDDNACGPGEDPTDDGGCPAPVPADYTISPEFLHQLVAVKKLLDLTGLPLIKLLAFWADISIAGEKPLYVKLFLTHNLLGIDKVFKPDAHGNYLTQNAKITDHLPVLMAALRLKADDITDILKFSFLKMTDAITLRNVTVLYRYSLLAKILHVRIPEFEEVIPLFGNPFRSPYQALDFLTLWGRMEDAGFTFKQLNYLIAGHDDALRPLASAKKTILQVSKTLFDGLTKIDVDHQDIKEENKEDANTELVRSKAGLLFDSSVVEEIIGLLEGTTVYSTNAPLDLVIKIPEEQKTLATKLKYSNNKDVTPVKAGLQVTGILTEEERTQAKALSANPKWAEAIDRVGKQKKNVFNNVLFGIFSDKDRVDAMDKLLAPDINLASDPLNPAATDANTAPVKRFYFLQHFLPFLRQQLEQRLIVDTLASASGLANDITSLLLSDVLVVGTTPQPAMSALKKIKDKPPTSGSGWKGYLIPSADAEYSFVADSLKDDDKPDPIVIDGQSIPFVNQQEDPSNVWSSDPTKPIKLKSGKLYWLEISDRPADQIAWKTSSTSSTRIPASSLLPDFTSQGTEEVFIKFIKSAILINGFSLSVDEIAYWQTHGADFKGDIKDINASYWQSHGTEDTADAKDFDFNAINLGHWWRLQSYIDLRNSLPRSEMTLMDLFTWANKPDTSKLNEKIATITAWKKENVDKLLKFEHFDLNRPEAFRNEANLIKLRTAMVVADKIGMDIERLFEWAKPGSKYWVCHQIAESIRKAIRARFDQEDWEQVVKPLNDQLRENQKQALISYLLVQPDLIDWGVVDADSLFEFFLIDVQMDACMETSRIKQAISSVQLFIQRCFLGLEDKLDESGKQMGVTNEALDRDRWEWMQRYRLWEANRKVFLYPENWILSELRDDKSPFYKELESELLQKDINKQTVEDALKNYLFKVDEVAHLKVVGLYVEEVFDQQGNFVPGKIHVFARSRNAPYFFYYRYYDALQKNWYPIEKIQVDIPGYDAEEKDTTGNSTGKILENGSYLIPVVWNKRLLIFFPQFMKKTAPNPKVSAKPIKDIGNNNTPNDSKPIEYWEIKIAWSEYRNAKWTQKQVSSGAIFDNPNDRNPPLPLTPFPLRDIRLYEFVPRIYGIFEGSEPRVTIDVFYDKLKSIGNTPLRERFTFTGNQLYVDSLATGVGAQYRIDTDFHYTQNTQIHTLQTYGDGDPSLFIKEPYFDDSTTKVTFHNDAVNLNYSLSFTHELLGKLAGGGLDSLFDYYTNKIPDDSPTVPHKVEAFGGDAKPIIYHELKRPFSLYNWEAAFHSPMLLVDRLLKSQQFEQALKMCHYVFNPHAKGSDSKRFWQFPPFKEIDAANVLEELFMGLQPGQPNKEISEWRDRPFQPHVIARSRPSAYMKWVAMTYIRILVEWGDYLFRQDTIETLNQATQLYVLAAHIYGPRGQKIPKRGKVKPQTYLSLLDKWDAFGNAMVELELVFPFSNQTSSPIGSSNGVVGLANVFGFATTLYFCIPDNPQLRALRDTIDDRLFKIRHCQNIEGVFRKLPLFEPPIDPALLVQAAAQGLSIASVLNDLNSPMPNYRFYYLLQKALELCSEVKALGNAFLSAKEKGDAEAISKLRARHESSIHNLVMEVKKQQEEEAGKSLEALQQSRMGPASRMQYYLKLIGEDLGKAPDANADFGELPNQIEQPVDESGLKLIQYEKEEMDKATEANDKQEDVGRTETLASILHIIPEFGIFTAPFGIGPDITIGGNALGNASQAVARANQVVVGNRTFSSANASRKAGFLRQLQDRIQQANAAGYEIKNIDKQMLTQQIRINIANQEITNQQKQIDNAKEVEEFLSSKYTNQELYSWMEGQIRTLYHQAYTLAYEMAKKAEKVFRFERGLTTSNFIQYGYWDAGYDGLLAGERLYIGLKQLEAAYQEKRGYDFEVIKPISLRQVNPLALIDLKEKGICEFSLPEVLFDMDYSGHYMRRIKSVALTIPCVVGPYTSMNCTLRLLEHKFRTSAIVNGKGDYPEKTDETDERFSTVNVPITSIAASTGQNDSGVFELNFRDERYIPFEGAGAISKWRLELPKDFKQFDYDTISDVVMQMRYTSLDGGDKLKAAAGDSVKNYIKSVEELSKQEGLFATFDLKHDFPDEWYKAVNPAVGATERVLILDNLNDLLPIFTKSHSAKNIQATDVYLLGPAALSVTLLQGAGEVADFGNPKNISETMTLFAIHDQNIPLEKWQLKVKDTKLEIDQLWLVVRYILK
jgi:hypothetical protein